MTSAYHVPVPNSMSYPGSLRLDPPFHHGISQLPMLALTYTHIPKLKDPVPKSSTPLAGSPIVTLSSVPSNDSAWPIFPTPATGPLTASPWLALPERSFASEVVAAQSMSCPSKVQ